MKAGFALAVSFVLSASAMAQAPRPPVEHIGKPMLGEQRLPFSEAWVGDMLTVGALGLCTDGKRPKESTASRDDGHNGSVLKRQG